MRISDPIALRCPPAVCGAACLCLIFLCAPARAQQTFELREDGFERVAAPEPDTPEGRLHEVRRAIADGRGREAVKLADRWIEQHPNHPLQAEAHLLRGDALSSVELYYKALFEYEHVARAYPGSEHFDAALEQELKIAQAFGRGVKRKLWGMRILPAEGEAEELLIRIQERAPGSKLAERAGIELADFYYRRSEMASAADAYDLFLQNYPDSQWTEHAMQRQVLANLATFKGPRFDATGLIEARQRLRDYQRMFPASAEQIGAEALLTRIDETLATRSLLVARWYEKQNKPVEARFMYGRVLEDHAGSAAARSALERLRVLEPQTFGEAAPGAGGASGEAADAAASAPDRSVSSIGATDP